MFVVLVLLVPVQTILWDGGFPSMEFRLRFVDAAGHPVPGVSLEVLTQAGGRCHYYPVDDFVPDRSVVSDADGRMTFRHFGHGLEYGGRDTSSVLGIPFRTDTAPQYDCVFLLDGQEIHRVRFNKLIPWNGPKGPHIERKWSPRNDGLLQEFAKEPNEDWDRFRLRMFDGNRDGVLDSEERVASGYAFRYLDSFEKERTVSLEIIEHTIVLPSR